MSDGERDLCKLLGGLLLALGAIFLVTIAAFKSSGEETGCEIGEHRWTNTPEVVKLYDDIIVIHACKRWQCTETRWTKMSVMEAAEEVEK